MKKMTKTAMRRLIGGGGNTCVFCDAISSDGDSMTSCWYVANPSSGDDVCRRVYPHVIYWGATYGPCTSKCIMKATDTDPKDASPA